MVGRQDRHPGSDYLTYSGSDQCALAHAWGTQFGKSLPNGGDIAIILGAPGNPTDPLEEKCLKETLPANIKIVAKQGTAWSRDAYQQATSAILADHPDIKGIVGATAMPSSVRSVPSRPPASRWMVSSPCTSPTTTRSCAHGRTPVGSPTRTHTWRCSSRDERR